MSYYNNSNYTGGDYEQESHNHHKKGTHHNNSNFEQEGYSENFSYGSENPNFPKHDAYLDEDEYSGSREHEGTRASYPEPGNGAVRPNFGMPSSGSFSNNIPSYGTDDPKPQNYSQGVYSSGSRPQGNFNGGVPGNQSFGPNSSHSPQAQGYGGPGPVNGPRPQTYNNSPGPQGQGYSGIPSNGPPYQQSYGSNNNQGSQAYGSGPGPGTAPRPQGYSQSPGPQGYGTGSGNAPRPQGQQSYGG
ncbi:hypothetical protein AYI68_g4867, partial [Smittium mucronatum]